VAFMVPNYPKDGTVSEQCGLVGYPVSSRLTGHIFGLSQERSIDSKIMAFTIGNFVEQSSGTIPLS